MLSRTIGLLFLISSCSNQGHNVEYLKYEGVWRFEDKNVYVVIVSSGNAYQCRVTRDKGTLFYAFGKLAPQTSIIWGQMKTMQIDKEKDDLTEFIPSDFSWGIEEVVLTGDELELTSHLGTFTHQKHEDYKTRGCYQDYPLSAQFFADET